MELNNNSLPDRGEKIENDSILTPLSLEKLVKLRQQWSPGLGGRFLDVSRRGNFLNPDQKIDLSQDKAIPNYQIFSDASFSERRWINTPLETWEQQMKEWVKITRNPFLFKLAEIEINQSQELTPQQIDKIMTTVKSFFSQDFREVKIDMLLSKIKEKYQFDELKNDFDSFANFCNIFGRYTGIAISHLILAELGIKDETAKKQIDKGINNLNNEEKDLLKIIDKLSKREHERRIKKEDKNNPENDLKTPDTNLGYAIIPNRGKEYYFQGQDRIRAEKIENGIEIFSVCDGAGIRGHIVADFIGRRLSWYLSKQNINDINKNKLIEICKLLQNETCNLCKNDGSSTLDSIIKLPNGKIFAIHVGEGNIARIDFSNQKGASDIPFRFLFKEHQVSGNDEGAELVNGVWRINGLKSKSFGLKTRYHSLPCELIYDVEELPKGLYIIGSDGLNGVLNEIFLNPEFKKNFIEFINSNNIQTATSYLVKTANQYASRKYRNPDDIAAIIVRFN